jgi:hypothetical protein
LTRGVVAGVELGEELVEVLDWLGHSLEAQLLE